MAKRRFTNTEWEDSTRHNKFWEVEVVPGKNGGYDMVKSWGKIGAVPISQTKHFNSAYAADTEVRKLVGQKLDKGYVERRVRVAPQRINATLPTAPAVPLRTTESEAVASATLNLSQRSAPTLAPQQPATRRLCAGCKINYAASSPTTNLCAACIFGRPKAAAEPVPAKVEEKKPENEKLDRFNLIELD